MNFIIITGVSICSVPIVWAFLQWVSRFVKRSETRVLLALVLMCATANLSLAWLLSEVATTPDARALCLIVALGGWFAVSAIISIIISRHKAKN